MATTAQLRKMWSPACTCRTTTITLHSGARITVNAGCVEAFKALDVVMQSFRYAPRSRDTGAFVCRPITGGKGYSLHAYGIAVDYNWNTNPYGPKLITDMPRAMVDAGKRIRTKKGVEVFRWGGDYRRNKDAMHWEVVCSPEDLRAGIDWSTVPMEPPREGDPSTWPVLDRGDRGPTVEKLQELLRAAGHGDLDRPGTFGPKTEAAVRAYQAARKLDVDGIVGAQTWTAILNSLPAAPGGESPVKRDTRDDNAELAAVLRLLGHCATRTLSRGSSDPCVKVLQRVLNEKAAAGLAEDGAFGPATEAAVRTYQGDHGLAVDGVAGPATWRSLTGDR